MGGRWFLNHKQVNYLRLRVARNGAPLRFPEG
jgi:hypothetical protein